jgi:hypothetical protein
MKRIAVLALVLAALGSLLYAPGLAAQDRNSRRWENFGGVTRSRPAAEQLTLTGTLGLSQGAIVLNSGDQTWYVPGLLRYTGFIEGLKEGAAVTLEGLGRKNAGSGADSGVLWVSKLTLNGKDYDLGAARPAIAQGMKAGNDRRSGPRPGYGRNSGGRSYHSR